MKNFFADWRLHWLLLLLPVALFLPALPIDETRYLAVAWEMWFRSDALLLHLNGAPYADKGPLLFWLINLAWHVAGLHVWVVRLGVLAASFASLLLFEHLVRRLDPSAAGRALAERAAMLLCGIIYFALFANAIMFDVLLMTCVLIALHGVLDLDRQRWLRGIAIFALGAGLGILTKGPVALLDAGLVAIIAPWWSATARANKLHWYAAIGATLIAAIVVALAWAIPAAILGGADYANAIFVHQTVGRLAKSFAHQRPFWWYFAALPLMLLPWTISLRAPWRAWRDSFFAGKAARFGIAWFVPAFVAFCCVSGKQPHYMLPLLPGLALYLAQVLGDDAARVRGRVFAVLLMLFGGVLFTLPFVAAPLDAQSPQWIARWITLTPQTFDILGTAWPLWGAMLVLLGAALIGYELFARARVELRTLALASAASATVCMLALAQTVGPSVDVGPTAAYIRAAQDAGRPIAHLAWHHGLFAFAGRLTQPLEKVDFDDLYTWCAAHPDGELISIYTKYPIAAKPEREVPYRLGRILYWNASAICAAPHTPPPAKPHADDDTTDED